MFNKVIYLITNLESEYDEDGFEKMSERVVKSEKIMANVKSTTYNEYNSASRESEKATDIFVMSEIDYKNAIVVEDGKRKKPSFVEYEGILYRIVRRFERENGNHLVELSCVEVE